MRVGVMILPESGWAGARSQWRTVEKLGFDSGWVPDHLSWRSLRDRPWFSTFPFLTAAAVATERIRIGTLVTSPNFRHPVVVAKDVVSIDDISGGRFTLGVGSGSTQAGDAQVVDSVRLSPDSRAARFQEFVEMLDMLLRNPIVDYSGQYFSAYEARMIPGCTQKPRVPIAIAAAGAKGQDLTAGYGDAWVTCGPIDVFTPHSQDRFRSVVQEQLSGLIRACERARRDPFDIERIVVTTDMTGKLLESVPAFVDHAAHYAEMGITEVVIQWPRADGPFAGDPGVLEEIATKALPHVHDM